MYPIDVLSSYIIIGVSCLLGAAILGAVKTDSPRTQSAVRLSMVALSIMGIALSSLLFPTVVPTRYAIGAAGMSSIGGIMMFGWGMRQLCHQRTHPRVAWVCIAAVLALLMACFVWSETVYRVGMPISGALICIALGLDQRQFIRPGRMSAETALGIVLVVLTASWMLRAGYSIAYEGPVLVHNLYVPSELIPPFLIGYGVMPVLAASLVFMLVNRRLIDRLQRSSHTDELTGVASRRALQDLGDKLLADAFGRRQQVAALMLDLDRFKSVNDVHGHLVGDAVLKHVARLVQARLRPDAMLVRYGGEEFVALVPVGRAATALTVAERIRADVQAKPFASGDLRMVITVSVGLSMCRPHEELVHALLRADALLYQAKRQGRNCVVSDLGGVSV